MEPILAGIAAIAGPTFSFLDQFIYTEQERAQVQAQQDLAKSQIESAKIGLEAAKYNQTAAAYSAGAARTQSQGLVTAALILSLAGMGVAIVMRGTGS